MDKIKLFECAVCKKLYFNNIKGEVRFISDRKGVREHLKKVHHINRQAGKPQHKGNRIKMTKGGVQDERSAVTQNCVIYKEF